MADCDFEHPHPQHPCGTATTPTSPPSDVALLVDRIVDLLDAHRGQGECITSCSIMLPEEYGGGECDCDLERILDALSDAADLFARHAADELTALWDGPDYFGDDAGNGS